MVFEDFKKKDSVVVVFTGEGKGKTSAGLGLMARALGNNFKVLFVQFIKDWEVGEHKFIKKIAPIFKDNLDFIQYGAGFYKAKNLSSKASEKEHKEMAKQAYQIALKLVRSGDYDLVICDEINNAVGDGLININDLEKLILSKSSKTNLCLTGRGFPEKLVEKVDIVTDMTKVKHHYDDKFLANKGVDY